MLAATTRIMLVRPEDVVAPLCAHLIEHDAIITREGDATVIRLGASRATLRATGGGLDIAVEAQALAGLQDIKLAIASHVVEFAPPGAVAAIAWTGDGTAPSLPPDFRVLTVTGAETIAPHMRRIRFHGADLGRFASLDALHVRLYIPPAMLAEPAWPMIGADGLLQQPTPEQRPAIRKYTIRQIDPASGTLAIDFVVHEDAGPGSAFATGAQIGDRIGMAGPGGRGLRQAERYIFLADETGLPAVGRMLENLPANSVGIALIEIEDARDEQRLCAPTGIAVRWLHRGNVAAGTSQQLQEAFAALAWRPDDPKTYLWAAMEFEAVKCIRAAARLRMRPDHDHHLVVSYWRNGLSEDQHAAEKRQPK